VIYRFIFSKFETYKKQIEDISDLRLKDNHLRIIQKHS